MPLLSPSQIHSVLKKEIPPPPSLRADPKAHLRQLLDNANLSPEEILDNLSSQMRSAESDATRLGAAKVALQLNGLLDNETQGGNFNVVINIRDTEFNEVNPILFPR